MQHRIASLLFVSFIIVLFQCQLTFAQDENIGITSPTETAACETEISENWYENIAFALSVTSIIQGLFGTDEEVNPDGEVVDASILARFEMTSPVAENGNAYMLIEARKGKGVDNRIDTWTGFNGSVYSDDEFELYELWYEQTSPENKWRLRGGYVDLTRDFDLNNVANCECTQFFSPGFVNNPAVEFPDDNGAGAMLWLKPNDEVDLGFAIADADADWDDIFDGMFSMIELDIKGKMKCGEGNYRFYGWLNAKDHPEILNEEKTSSGQGFGISFDQVLNDNVTAFARYGWQRDDVYEVGSAWSLGVQFVDSRENVLGLAYGRVVMGGDKKDFDLMDGIASGNEHHVEIYYSIKVNDNLCITPDFQWIRNVGAVRDNGDAWSLGVRAFLEL